MTVEEARAALCEALQLDPDETTFIPVARGLVRDVDVPLGSARLTMEPTGIATMTLTTREYEPPPDPTAVDA